MASKITVFVFCVIAIDAIIGRKLPSYLKPCKQNDPGINACLKTLVESLRSHITEGIPEMHVLPLDPLAVPSVNLNQGSESVNFRAVFTDLKGYGAKNYQVLRMNANLKNRSLEIDLNFPLFKIKSQYEVKGKILMLPIEGKGAFVGNFTNAKAKIKFTLKIVKKKNDRNFFEIKSNKIHLEFGAVKLNFSNMFNGNKEMGDQTNVFINENWKDLMQETQPLIEDTVAAIVVGIFKPVFQTYSVDDLFPV